MSLAARVGAWANGRCGDAAISGAKGWTDFSLGCKAQDGVKKATSAEGAKERPSLGTMFPLPEG